MDPNETLRRIRILVREIQDPKREDDSGSREELLAELISALDEWLSNGGFLPRDWAQSYPWVNRGHE